MRVLFEIGRDIKLSHTVFALPFALLGMFYAASGWPGWWSFALILLCMFFARTMAMTFNRFADARFDATNPRTTERAVPAGRVGRGVMLTTSLVCAVCFILAAGGFWRLEGNFWPMVLSPWVVLVLIGYSLAKRFTWACHLILGFALGMSPAAAGLAIEPSVLGEATLWLLAGAVLAWVAGFDCLYAMQDIDVDRATGLHSIPAKLGVGGTLWVARALHLCCAALLFGVWYTGLLLGWLFFAGVVLAAGLLLIEHLLVSRSTLHRIPAVFITVNGVVSVVLGFAGILDVLR